MVAFTDDEIARYAALIERLIWARHRPPLHLRNQVREGQRIVGQEIELFLVRPDFSDPSRWIEQSIAQTRYVKTRDVWQVFWKRADMKWHRYPSCLEVKTLEGFLELVDEDKNGYFWG